MTMGWHLVMEFRPSLIGCYIWSANHSFEMIRRSKECVVNIPEVKLAPKVVGIGNTFGREIDKFAKFGLTAKMGKKVKAPIMADALQAMNVDLSMHACPEIQPVRPRGGGGSRCCLAEISSDYALSG